MQNSAHGGHPTGKPEEGAFSADGIHEEWLEKIHVPTSRIPMTKKEIKEKLMQGEEIQIQLKMLI